MSIMRCNMEGADVFVDGAILPSCLDPGRPSAA